MSKIVICKINYPNDKTQPSFYNIKAHIHFVCEINDNSATFYSISSLLGKETKVLLSNGQPKETHYVFTREENNLLGFRKNSFINCSVSFKLDTTNINLNNLKGINLPSSIEYNILYKIKILKSKNMHKEYIINPDEFLLLNSLANK